MSADPSPIAPSSMTARQSQKAATRRKVLSAARDLFDTYGYVDTTIRDIARRAEVAVGSVFTTFASKGDILSQVMEDRLAALYQALDEGVDRASGSTADRLKAIFAISYGFEAPRLRLFLSHIAATYDWSLPETAMPYGRTPRIREILRSCLEDGAARGDVDPAADLDDILNLILAANAWSYRLVAWKGAGAQELAAEMDRQIDLISLAFRPRA